VIVFITNIQNKGKTLTLVHTLAELLMNGGYSPKEVAGNLTIRMRGYTKYKNEELRAYIEDMLKNEVRHKVVLIDEVDGVYPARFWNRGRQTEQLLGLWQDFKLFNWFIMTGHIGNAGSDLIVRAAATVYIEPTYIKGEDKIYINGYDKRSRSPFYQTIHPASAMFPFYKRWEPIK